LMLKGKAENTMICVELKRELPFTKGKRRFRACITATAPVN
jgi:hypothetical protein